jgi:hypothetical protein
MNKLTILQWLCMLIITLMGGNNAFGYGAELEKEICKKPKIYEFSLPEYKAPEKKEVAPETELLFKTSVWADVKKIKIEGKGIEIPYTADSNDSFHTIHAKLPAEFTGKYVRLSIRVPAILECVTKLGWLIKVSDSPTTPATPSEAQGAEKPSTNAESIGETPSAITTEVGQKEASTGDQAQVEKPTSPADSSAESESK